MIFRNLAVFILCVFLLVSCQQAGGQAVVVVTETAVFLTSTPLPTAAPSHTPTPAFTPTPTATPLPSATPTLTPTPTPTAVPLTITGDPRAIRLNSPIPQANAPCGYVDIFDFPMNPPDALNLSGGRDFGVFRDRYDKFHAGEDWWATNRSQTFGTPVYSIGHGLVTYAEPEGWNRDKGVVIVQHVLGNGRILLSFYGHLDPPSVVLQAGDCVERGEQVGQVGQPRSSPHLHFEIRTQSPYTPLTGYWPEDPTLMGWLPPSQTIWNQRIASFPGVQWTRPFAAEGTKMVAVLGETTLLLLEDAQLVALDATNGRSLWQYDGGGEIESAVLDAQSQVIYTTSRTGRVEALAVENPTATNPTIEPLWQVELGVFGAPLLLPLPADGVVVSVRQQLFGIAPDGTVRWIDESFGQPFAWTLTEDGLLMSTSGSEQLLMQVNGDGLELWNVPENGQMLVIGDEIWLHGRNGLYTLDTQTKTAELRYSLPEGSLWLGDAVALPDGGLLVAHADPFDRRLLVFAADGSLRWERSYAGFIAGEVQLLVVGEQVVLVSTENNSSVSTISVFVVNLETAELTHGFTGGTRTAIPADTWMLPMNQQLLLNIGGGHMLVLDTQEAFTAVTAQR